MRNALDGPPAGSSLPSSPPCPFCESAETELVSPFGGQISVAQYWCRSCRTGFEYMKWEAETPRGDAPGE